MRSDDGREDWGTPALCAHGDDLADANPVRRTCDAHAIHRKESMSHHLAGLHARHGKTCTEDDIVQTFLQETLEDITRLSRHAGSDGVEVAELFLGKAEHVARFLFLLELLPVFRKPALLRFRPFAGTVRFSLQDFVVLIGVVDVHTVTTNFPCFGTRIFHW